MLSIFGPVSADTNPILLIVAYTIFHYAAFFVVGLLAVMIIHVARREPSVLLGFVVLFAPGGIGAREFVLQTALSQWFRSSADATAADAMAVVVALVLRLVWW